MRSRALPLTRKRRAAPIAGRARPAQRHGASVRAARESRARLFMMNDAVFKGRVEPGVHDRTRNVWCDRWGSNPLRLAPQASASTASASATMRARNDSNARPTVWNRGRRLDSSPRINRGDRLRADPLVMFTGVPERQLSMQRVLPLRADPTRRHADDEAIRIRGPQTVAFGSWQDQRESLHDVPILSAVQRHCQAVAQCFSGEHNVSVTKAFARTY
jgi:hypothetical protein